MICGPDDCPGPPAWATIVFFSIIVLVIWVFLFSISWIFYRKRISLVKLSVITFVTAVALFILWLAWALGWLSSHIVYF